MSIQDIMDLALKCGADKNLIGHSIDGENITEHWRLTFSPETLEVFARTLQQIEG